MAKATAEMHADAFEAVERLRKNRGFDNVEAQQLYMSLLQFTACLQTGNLILAAELCETAGIEMGRRLREIAEKGKDAALLEAGGSLPAQSAIIATPKERPIATGVKNLILPH